MSDLIYTVLRPRTVDLRRLRVARSAKKPERAGKPNSVPRPGLPDRSRDHSSRPEVAFGLQQPTRKRPAEAGGTGTLPSPYLALLRMGFTVPPPLPSGRCALTAPFHPYRPDPKEFGRRSVFCGTFLRVAATGCYPACRPLWSSDFPPRLLGAIAWPARAEGNLSISEASENVPRRKKGFAAHHQSVHRLIG